MIGTAIAYQTAINNMSATRMEQPRAATEEERLLARNCAFVAQDLADFLVTVAERNAKVSDLLMKRLLVFMAFPPAVDFMLEGLR